MLLDVFWRCGLLSKWKKRKARRTNPDEICQALERKRKDQPPIQNVLNMLCFPAFYTYKISSSAIERWDLYTRRMELYSSR